MDQKPVVIYTMEYYTAERKKELLPFLTEWVDLESIMLSEISQVVKDKNHMNCGSFLLIERLSFKIISPPAEF